MEESSTKQQQIPNELEMSGRLQTVSIIGCGSMGTAILKGLLRWTIFHPTDQLQYIAHVRSHHSWERLKQEFPDHVGNVTCTYGDDYLLAAAQADIVILGVLPDDLDQTLGTRNLAFYLQGRTIVSMLAGVSSSQLIEALKNNALQSTFRDYDVTRIMPTLSAKLCESVTIIADRGIPSPAASLIHGLLARLGTLHPVPERLMDTATAIGAAVHALTIVAVDTATDASVAEGMPREAALELTAQCLRSCSSLMVLGDMTPESVKAAMSTPAGITLNSVVHLDANVRPGIAGAVRNAVQYTKSMNN